MSLISDFKLLDIWTFCPSSSISSGKVYLPTYIFLHKSPSNSAKNGSLPITIIYNITPKAHISAAYP